MLFKNTTSHEKRFPIPGGGKKRDEVVFPAGGIVEVSDEEVEALNGSRVVGAWIKAGELVVHQPKQAASALDSTGGAELPEGEKPAGELPAVEAETEKKDA